MIRRFVQHQDVRVCETEAGERDAGFLAAGEERHFLQAGHAGDAEGAEVAAVFFVLFAGEIFRHEADGAGVHVEGVDVVLGEEADAEAWVLADEALGGGELADEEFEDGGFAGAVGADDADAGVELDVEVDVGEEGFVGGVAKGDVGHLNDWWGELLDVGEFEVNDVFGFRGFEDGHFFELFDAGLGFGGFGGVVTEFVDEGLEVSALAHLVLVFAFGRFAAFFLGGVE